MDRVLMRLYGHYWDDYVYVGERSFYLESKLEPIWLDFKPLINGADLSACHFLMPLSFGKIRLVPNYS
jgi:hypothetical protein